MKRTLVSTLLLLSLIAAPRLHAVVISEIFYFPADGDIALEFVEIANESSTPEDISGFHFTSGIRYEFPPGTILEGRARIAVAANATALRAEYDIDNAVGNFEGRLDRNGERLTLADFQGVEVTTVRYRDEGKWPTAGDGTGHSIVLKDLSFDPTEPESWTWSPQLGGSPGEANFPELESGESELIASGANWNYLRGTAEFSNPIDAWTEVGFDDASWESDAAGWGYGDGDDRTVLGDMRNGYSSVACRNTFFLSSSDVASADLTLGILFDDGFCAYVNGEEFASENCPGTLAHDALASAGSEANDEERYEIPRQHLRAGENVIAIAGYNVTIDSTDFTLDPRVLIARSSVAVESRPVFSELHRSPGGGWFELHQPGPTPVSLSGLTLSTDPQGLTSYDIPAGRTIPAEGFLTFSESETGFDLSLPQIRLFLRGPDGVVIAADTFDRAPPEGVDTFSEAMFPESSDERWITTTGTPGAANEVPWESSIVINEIFYHPPEDREGEFVELFHRGSTPVDISGFRLDSGVSYEFPEGTIVQPGAYLVVAEDPDVLEFTHSISGVFGPFEGGLSNRGENVRLVDRWNNLVDEVRYHDGGDWDLWADGGGASLELIDPNQVNDFGSAWAASDESEKASWAQYSYSVPDYRTGAESELKLFLVERGISLIDDVSVRRGNGSNHIPNSGFESSTSGWRIEGTHILSRRVTWDARSGNACLEINATGKGDSSVNRIEVDTSPSLSRGSYEVSFWARWLRGASVVVGHGVFTSGPWGGRPGPSVNSSGNTLGGHVRLNVPTNLGTPGAENSARRNLRESSGSSNLGPVFANVLHSPASPDEDDEVVVSAIVSDADDVDEVEVRFREGDANGSFQTREMSVVPNSGGLLYSARLPRFSRNRKVVFWLEATDGAGRTRRYPENAPDRTLLFQTSGPNSSSLESTAIILDDARNSELGSRRVHSNHLLDATFVMDDRRVYYNVGVRYRGSPWGRPERTNYRVRFQKDQPTYSGLRAVNLSSRANGPVEAASYFLIGRSGTPEKPVSYPIYRFVASRVNGSSRGVTRLIQVVDGSYLDRWFPGSDGPAYKAVARLGFNDGGQRVTYDGASYDYMDRSPENYRFYYYPITDRSRDDWESLSELMRVMDPSATSNTVHDQLIDQILDLEGFLRVMVPRVFVSDWDTLGIGQGHNAYLVQDTNDGLYETIAFDLNQAMPGNQVNFPVFPNFDRGWTRLISRPRARRLYARIALEFMDGYWSVPRANAFLSQMEDDVGISMNEVRSFIPARANIMRPQIAAFDNFDLEITTGGGDDIDTKSSSITLRGEAPASIATIVYQRNREESAEVDVVWETPNRWRARFDLPSSTNEFDFFGFATDGSLIDSTGITVNNLSVQGDRFTRGDANFDDVVDLSDALEVLLGLFGGQDIACPDAADADDSGAINITDAVHILQFLFQGGSAPATPFPQDGEDPTEDALICRDEV